MPTFQELTNADFTTNADGLDIVIDVIESDISSSSSRRQYQHYITGALSSSGVTSSLYQTIYDQDFTLQTANPIFDLTVGLSPSSSLVLSATLYTDSTTGQIYFPSQSLMMREKIQRYKEMAQTLIGDADSEFTIASGSSTITIREPMFLSWKRLFTRDRIKRETFAIKLFESASILNGTGSSQKIYTDVGSATNQEFSFGGGYSTIVDSANVTTPVGLLYLDKGIAVLDTQRIFAAQNTATTYMTGTFDAVNASGTTAFTGSLNQFLVSGSIDDIVDHLATTRFGSSSLTAIAYQNQTVLNSSIITVRLPYSYFNYSSNPTFVDSNGRIVTIEQGQEDVQRSFTMYTSIGFYDANNNMLAIAKTSRPVFKDASRSTQITVRIDY